MILSKVAYYADMFKFMATYEPSVRINIDPYYLSLYSSIPPKKCLIPPVDVLQFFNLDGEIAAMTVYSPQDHAFEIYSHSNPTDLDLLCRAIKYSSDGMDKVYFLKINKDLCDWMDKKLRELVAYCNARNIPIEQDFIRAMKAGFSGKKRKVSPNGVTGRSSPKKIKANTAFGGKKKQ